MDKNTQPLVLVVDDDASIRSAIRRLLVSAGLAVEVYASGTELMQRTLETARLLASKSPVALAYAKEAANLALQGSHDAGLTQEASFFAMLFSTEDAKEGLAAFAEKREPRFVGR